MAARKVIYTRDLGKQVASSATPDKVTMIHVISSYPDKWSVVIEGKNTSYRTALPKEEAIAIARRKAAETSATLIVIHDRDGKVTRKIKVS